MSSSEQILSDITLGLSLSDSPDLKARGFSDVHFRDILIEFSRSMLACGATLAYGGDFRAGGFTDELPGLKATYKGNANKIVSYLGWPIYLLLEKMSDDEKLRYREAVVFHQSSIPDGVDASIPRDKFLVPDKRDPKTMLVWARSMTRMRQELLAKRNDAQVMLGGRMVGYSSKYPGVVEEAYEILKAGKPLFLIGAFGGATQVIIDAISGKRPESLTEEGQYRLWAEEAAATNKPENYKGLVEYYNQNAPETEERIDYSKLTDFFNEKGVGGLNNNLSPEENQRLFETPHVAEMIALTRKGLVKIKKP